MSTDHKPASPRPSFNFNDADWKSYRNKPNDLLNKIDIDIKITTTQQIETCDITYRIYRHGNKIIHSNKK
jgi:hypothetical protein